MESCIFCQVVAGKVPAYKVYEDNEFLAFLDIKPLTKGNALVVPKKHYRWVDDVPNFGDYFEAARKVGKAAQNAFDAHFISYITIGLEVPHAHIRVVPRYKDDKHGPLVTLDVVEDFGKEEMAEIAGKIKESLDDAP